MLSFVVDRSQQSPQIRLVLLICPSVAIEVVLEELERGEFLGCVLGEKDQLLSIKFRSMVLGRCGVEILFDLLGVILCLLLFDESHHDFAESEFLCLTPTHYHYY